MFPFDNTRMTPNMEKIMEINCKKLIFSFKNKKEKSAIETIFNVDIKPTFVAVVLSSAKNCNRLNRTTPVIPITNKGIIALIGGRILFSFHHTIGTRQRTAIPHLRVVNVSGEACSTRNLLTTKFPPQNNEVRSSK